jgi:N-acetylmuramoyl-L-alanine amidase
MLFVFVDLLKGELPWSSEAKIKDKVAVGAIKDRMVSCPDMLMEWIFGESDCGSVVGGVTSSSSEVSGRSDDVVFGDAGHGDDGGGMMGESATGEKDCYVALVREVSVRNDNYIGD